MKNERRHELQHNDLADWIAKKFKAIEPYSKSLLAIAIAACVIFFAYSFISGRAKDRETAEWDHFDGTEEELNGVVQRHAPGTSVGDTSHLALANLDLRRGIRSLFMEKDGSASKKLIQSALDNYAAVAKSTSDNMLKQMAICGKARAHESLGQLNEAKSEYEKLLKFEKGAIFDDYSKQRIAELNRPSIKTFYDKLTELAAKPASGPGTPGERPPLNPDDLFKSSINSSKFDPIKGGLDPAQNDPQKSIDTPKPTEDKKPSGEVPPAVPTPEKSDEKSPPTIPPVEPKSESK